MSVRRLLCEKCGDGKTDCIVRMVYERTETEPAEYERVVWGIVRHPTPEQRTMHINGAPFPMPPEQFDCDNCGAEIRPGARACAVSYWAEGQSAPAAWEGEFVMPEVVRA